MKMKWEIFNVIIFAITPLLAAPAHSKRRSDQVIPGQYIIQLDPSLSAESVTEHLSRRNINPDNFFQFGSFNAYTGVFTDESIAAIVNLPDVLSIEPDRLIFQEWTSPTKARKRDLVTQANSPWHLGDVSHKAAGSTDYVFDNAAGQGQRAYILDSGIRLTHNEFGGRAVFGFNGVTGSAVQNGTNTDTDGHGTHVAGIAVGKQNGIANKAIVVDVKVSSGGSGQLSWILAGYNWAVNDIVQRGVQQTSVINLSLATYAPSPTWESAIIAAYNLGIITVVAAGNNDGPASEWTPARMPEVITVGMTVPARSRASFIEGVYGSNYGPELDVFAPGSGIISASYTSNDGFLTETGTSMASPLVAGLICYLRSVEGGLNSPEDVRARLIELSQKDVVIDPKGSPNVLVYNGSGS